MAKEILTNLNLRIQKLCYAKAGWVGEKENYEDFMTHKATAEEMVIIFVSPSQNQ